MTSPHEISRALLAVYGGPTRLHEPFITDADKAFACSVDPGVGPESKMLEDALCDEIGRDYCVLTCSGTVALHAALHLRHSGRRKFPPECIE